MNKGQLLTLKITDLNNLGCGVGRDETEGKEGKEGKVVFVKGAVTGDTVRASVIKVNKSYAVAKLSEIVDPSPYRTDEEFCDAPLACGGCMYRAITYEHELTLKSDYVKNAFVKAGLREVTVLPTLSTGVVSGYRNKAQYPVASTKQGIRAGFYSGGTHSIVPAEHCAIQHKEFAPIVDFICEYATEHRLSAYDETTGKGLLRHIYLRIAERTNEIMVCLVLNGASLPNEEVFVSALTERFPSVKSVLLNTNKENTNVVLGKSWKILFGTNAIEDILCGLRFRISADAFYQVNRAGAELLYGKAAELAELSGGELLMDLYCGTGTIGLSMAKNVGKLIGIEIVEGAVKCAKENAERNGVANAEFYCGDASSREMILRCTGGVTPDVVVIDPPRKGSTRELVECLASLDVKKIVYVSCNPDTLARDVAVLKPLGYATDKVQPVDMFPATGHVESVVCLTRK